MGLLPLLPSGPDGVHNLHVAQGPAIFKNGQIDGLFHHFTLGYGGERGIRTLGASFSQHTRFPVVLLQPLGHLSYVLYVLYVLYHRGKRLCNRRKDGSAG